MGPSRTLVRTGMRTSARPSWRTGAGAALAVVVATPSLWLLGALGFLVRGGALVLLLPVLVLPSPIALRLLVGDNLTSSGFGPGFYLLLLGCAVVLVALVLIALAVVARVEVAAFARLRASQSVFEGASARPVAGRHGLARGIFTIQLVALCGVVAAGIPLVVGAISATYAELLRPTLGGPLYDRVLAQLSGPLYLLLAVLVIVEAASAVATRRLLTAAHENDARMRSPLTAVLVGLGRPVLAPVRTVGTALLGWLISAAVLLPALWVIGAAWDGARGALLAHDHTGSAGIGALVAVLVLCAAWLGGVALAGFAAAVRAALWTSQEQR